MQICLFHKYDENKVYHRSCKNQKWVSCCWTINRENLTIRSSLCFSHLLISSVAECLSCSIWKSCIGLILSIFLQIVEKLNIDLQIHRKGPNSFTTTRHTWFCFYMAFIWNQWYWWITDTVCSQNVQKILRISAHPKCMNTNASADIIWNNI